MWFGNLFALRQTPASGAPPPYEVVVANPFPVTTNSAVQEHPSISGNSVVWQDQRNGNSDIYGKDLSTGQEFPVTTNPSFQLDPAISGNIVVWRVSRNGNYDIYGNDLARRAQECLWG